VGHPSGPLDLSDDRGRAASSTPRASGNAVSDGVAPTTPSRGPSRSFRPGSRPVGRRADVAVDREPDPSRADRRRREDSRGFLLLRCRSRPSLLAGLRALPGRTPQDGLRRVPGGHRNTASISTQIRLDTAGPALDGGEPRRAATSSRGLSPSWRWRAIPRGSATSISTSTAPSSSATQRTPSRSTGTSAGSRNGPHVLGVIAVDGVGRETRKDIGVSIADRPPTAPVIGRPRERSDDLERDDRGHGHIEPRRHHLALQERRLSSPHHLRRRRRVVLPGRRARRGAETPSRPSRRIHRQQRPIGGDPVHARHGRAAPALFPAVPEPGRRRHSIRTGSRPPRPTS